MAQQVTEKALTNCPPALKVLLAAHNNSYAAVAKLLGADKSHVGKWARADAGIPQHWADKIAELNGAPPPQQNGVQHTMQDQEPVDTDKLSGQPLLEALLARFGGSRPGAAKALGYVSPQPIYGWLREPETFADKAQHRVRDFLAGREFEPLRSASNRKDFDKGELGIVIVIAPKAVLETILDVGEGMSVKFVFRKQFSAEDTWLVIGRPRNDKLLEPFKLFCRKMEVEVITP